MNGEGEKTSKLGLVAGEALTGLLEKLWNQPHVLSLTYYISPAEFATQCFVGAHVPLMFWGTRGCVVYSVGTS